MSLVALDDLVAELKKHKVTGAQCKTPQQLARVVSGYQDIIENVVNEIIVEIINIINTGGGGATAPVFIIRALVAQLGSVPATQTTFPFDGETLLFSATGDPPVITDHTAQNWKQRFFQDNEVVILTSFNGTVWFPDKTADSTIAAFVDEDGGVTTAHAEFDFDGAVAISGTIPLNGEGTVVNFPAHAYEPNEEIVLTLIEQGTDAGKWLVLQDDDDLGGGGGGSLTAGFCIDVDQMAVGEVALISTGFSEPNIQFFAHQSNNDPRWNTPNSYTFSALEFLCHPASSSELAWLRAEFIEIDL